MMLTILKYLGIFFLVLVIACVTTILVLQQVSDGPIEPMQGGPFKTGEVVDAPVTDWSFAADKSIEFELEGAGTSRVAGFIMHEGEAYMTCDLGFIWNRLESGQQKAILNLIYIFKRWHKDAVEDGRVRLRIDGKIYSANFVKVEDPAIIDALKLELEARAREFFAPTILPPAPESAPNDIWFFRMDPR